MPNDIHNAIPPRGESPHTRRGFRWWYAPIVLLSVFVILLAGIWIFRRPIIGTVVNRVNEGIPGTISAEDGSLTWKRFFTRMSLTLENTILTDQEDAEVILSEQISIVVNPFALLRRRIHVESLLLSGLSADLSISDSGNLNLYKALGISPGRNDRKLEDGDSADASPEAWRRWNADISNLRIEDCHVILRRSGDRASLTLEYLNLDFYRAGNDGIVILALALSDIHSVGLGPGYLRGKRYTLDVAIDVNEGIAVIRSGNLGIQGAQIALGGSLALFYPFDARLGISAHGTDTDLLLSFLPPGVTLGNVAPEGNGRIGIEGSVFGPLAGNPEIGITLTCEDFGMRHLPTGLVMDQIGFHASARKAYGPMVFEVHDFGARLPDGSFSGRVALDNLKEPDVEIVLKSSLELQTLASFIVFPGSRSINGHLELDVDVAGKLNGSGMLVDATREKGDIHLTDFRYQFREGSAGIRNLDLLFRLDDGMMVVNSLQASTDLGEIGLKGSFGNVWPLILGGEGLLDFSLEFSSPHFNPSPLFSDPEVAAAWDMTFNDMEMAFSFHTGIEALRNRDPLPAGIFRIVDMRAKLPVSGKELSRFSGEVEIGEGLRSSLSGQLNSSEVQLQVDIDGYRGLLIKEESRPITAYLQLSAPTLVAADVLPAQPLDGEGWKGQDLQDLNMDLELEFQNSEWFSSRGHWPDGHWILQNLSGTAVGTGRAYSISFDLQASDGTAELARMTGKIGDSDFIASGHVENAGSLFLGTPEDLRGSLTLESRYWDMAEVFGIAGRVSDRNDEETPDTPNVPLNLDIGGRVYPSVELEVKVDEFHMHPYHWKNLGGKVTLGNRGILLLDNLRLNNQYDASARLDGRVDISRKNSFLLDAKVEVQDLNLETSRVPMEIGEDSFYFGDRVKGVLSGNVTISTAINPDLSFNLDESMMEVRAHLSSGRLLNFPAFVAIGDKLGTENMNDVRLDDLTLRAELRNGVLHIPGTAVGSNLGYLEVEGSSRLKGYMSYSITVPNSVIDGIVSGLVFGNFGDGDEIITAENAGRNRTTVNVVGDSEDIIINLGKRGRSRLEERWERRRFRREKRAGR